MTVIKFSFLNDMIFNKVSNSKNNILVFIVFKIVFFFVLKIQIVQLLMISKSLKISLKCMNCENYKKII
jgi:hypothetical protein